MYLDQTYDEYFMQICLSLAVKGWGTTLTNPLVGAVVVNKNRIVGQGFHRRRGEAHAEIIALIDAGKHAQGATLYVNLEPCCCTGRTPPCVPAIVQAGIKRVVIGTIDPYSMVNGKGVEQLRAHNIEVRINVLSREAQDVNRAYLTWITRGTPYMILKIAVTSNGRLSGYPSRYITSIPSLRYVHALRSRVNAVMVGINTVQNDDPMLTDRLVKRNDPARIILDPDLKIAPTAHVLRPGVRRIIITRSDDKKRITALKARGVELHFYKGHLCPVSRVLHDLATLDIGSVMIEGGAMVFEEFFNTGAYDEIYLFMAPCPVEQGISLTESILRSIVLEDKKPQMIGEDRLYHVYRHH